MQSFSLNSGTGMALGAIVAVIISFIVSAFGGDIWAWSIPIGVSVGFAVGSGYASLQQGEEVGQ